MKRTNRILSMMLGVAILFGASSCEEKVDPIIGGGDGDIAVGDGFYFAKAGEDPATTAWLQAATVDAPDFSAQAREGFVSTYAYLTAGSYNLVEVESKAVVNTYGGTVESITEVPSADNEECETTEYSLVNASVDGAAFSIAADGLYVLAYDAITSEIVYDQIVSAGIIGAATPGGWSADTPMIGSATADGANWSIEGVTLDVGQMKFRFNCRWAIDRRIDSGEPFDNANGYTIFTNYGGAIDNLLPGNEGANIEIAEYAVYTVTFAWSPNSGVSATATKTGEAEEKPEYPAELYVVGGSLGGWDWDVNGVQLNPVHSNPHLFWAIVWLDNDTDTPLDPADPGLKFSPIASWDDNFGVDAGAGATEGVYGKGNDNVPGITTSGYYMIVANMVVGSETVEVNKPLIYGVGDAFEWTFDPPFIFTEDAANKVMTSPAFTVDGNVRMYTTATTFTPVGDAPAVEWWHAEFNVFNGVIEYRGTGDDQAAVAGTAGQTVSLKFTDGTGTFQ